MLFHSQEMYASGLEGHKASDILTQFRTIINSQMTEKMGEEMNRLRNGNQIFNKE